MKFPVSALVAAVIGVLGAAPLAAQEWVLGGDVTRFGGGGPSMVPGITLEVHGAPQWNFGPVDAGFGVAGRIDDRGGAWVGGGVSALVPVSDDFYAEASLMPGYYRAGSSATDLGHRLQFRTLIGAGYIIDRDMSVSLAVSHMSNFGFGDKNPGADTLSLRLRRSF